VACWCGKLGGFFRVETANYTNNYDLVQAVWLSNMRCVCVFKKRGKLMQNIVPPASQARSNQVQAVVGAYCCVQ
jgi:hypothetical protein